MNILLLLLFIIALSYLTFLGFYLLSNYPTQIRQLKNFKQACAKNDITTIRSLLNKQNFNPNRATIGKITGMHIACKNGHIEAVSTLLTHPDIQPNQTNSHGQTPFFMACINNRHDLVSHLLLDKTFNVNQPDKKQTPFYATCRQATIHGFDTFKSTIMVQLESERISVNETDSQHGWTALILASHYGEEELVKILLENERIDKLIIANDGYTTAANTAENLGHTNIAKMIEQTCTPTN
jgi:ankyrin repeat protein